jgi:hypothetical protein
MQNLLANHEDEQKETGRSGALVRVNGQDRRGTSQEDEWDSGARNEDFNMIK